MPWVGLAVWLAVALALPSVGAAGGSSAAANIVTGLDISDSVSIADTRAQVAALAAAFRAPELLSAIGRGREGRIGVAVFTWHDNYFEVVPWTLVGSRADAEAVARAIEARGVAALGEGASEYGAAFGVRFIGRLTDLSRAIDHAAELLARSPFDADRAVVNIVGNGADNLGEPAAAARDRLVASGATVNGVVLNGEPAVVDYFLAEVAGGPGAFVMVAEGTGPFDELMRRKLLRDLMAAAD
jgi:hypothetical protein